MAFRKLSIPPLIPPTSWASLPPMISTSAPPSPILARSSGSLLPANKSSAHILSAHTLQVPALPSARHSSAAHLLFSTNCSRLALKSTPRKQSLTHNPSAPKWATVGSTFSRPSNPSLPPTHRPTSPLPSAPPAKRLPPVNPQFLQLPSRQAADSTAP